MTFGSKVRMSLWNFIPLIQTPQVARTVVGANPQKYYRTYYAVQNYIMQ